MTTPFGGSFNAYNDLSTPQQDYLYNGVKLNKTTQLYETAFRTYDPYLGRFNHIDPLAAMVPGLSPYHFGFNNPVRYNDPLGLMGQDPGIWGTGDTYASNNSQNPFDFMPKFTRTNPGSGNHWSDEYRDPYHNWMSMDTDSFNGMDYILKFKWVDDPTTTVSGDYRDGSLTVSAKRPQWVLYDVQASGGIHADLLNIHASDKEKLYTINDFVTANSGKTLLGIINQRNPQRMLGIPLASGGPKIRYIQDPQNPNVVIDLRHLTIIGSYWEGFGNAIESGQSIGGEKSAFDQQNYFYNNLGYEFSSQYGQLINQNPENYAVYLQVYLINRSNSFYIYE